MCKFIKKISFTVCIMLLISFLSTLTIHVKADNSNQNNTRALLIAGYDDSAIYTESFNNSANFVEEALRKVNIQNITKYCMSDNNRYMTHNELETLLKRTFDNCKNDDFSVIYYSGHSFRDLDEDGNPTVHTTTFSSDSFQTFYDLIKDNTKGTVLLIYDGCFAGELLKLDNYDDRIKIIAASDADEESHDMPMNYLSPDSDDNETICSILSYAFKELINTQSMDCNGDGTVCFDELELSLTNLVINIAQRYATSHKGVYEAKEFILHYLEMLGKKVINDNTDTYKHLKELEIPIEYVQGYPSGDKTELFYFTNANTSTKSTSDERDIVLALDVSGSMSGTPLDETKKATTKFIDTILDKDASIGIVTYDDSADMVSDFSVDKKTLETVANNIRDGGSTNIEAGLKKAKEMLSTSNAKKKIIVLMSDGEPNDGKVGDELISYADSIKKDGTYIYTLGFFQSVGSNKSSAQTLMEQIASDGCHYEVSSAEDLVFFFGDIADQINGQKYIYVRIACPVDVSVSYKGETLSSSKDDPKTRTSFGSLTFEESTEASTDSSDDRVKILRLKDDFKYDIKINGNGSGSMDYTIGFMNENGDYGDLREFNDIDINKNTQIDTVAVSSNSTTLKVDSDGDGKYDLRYKAKANSIAEIVNYSYIIYTALGILILIFALIMYIKIKKWKKQRTLNKLKKKAAKKKFCLHCGTEMSGEKVYCKNCGKKLE